MIKLHSDCLVFETPGGDRIPCSAEAVSVELLGDSAAVIDPEIVRNATAAVLHYFRVEQGRESVTVREFMEALKTALRGLGLNLSEAAEPVATTTTITAETEASSPVQAVAAGVAAVAPGSTRVTEMDLRTLASESGTTFELSFFPRLREVMGEQLNHAPNVLRFIGLRSCVKQLTGARRWTHRCEALSDQIVTYLRECLSSRPIERGCALVVV
jgi:hypothetical protein